MPLLQEEITLDADEQVLGLFRPHTFFVIAWTFPMSLLLIGLFLFMFKFFLLGFFGVLFFVAVFLLLFFIFISRVMAWYGTLYILTSRRLLAIKRSSLIKKQVTEVLLENVSELSYTMKGLLQTLLRFGNIQLSLFAITSKFTVTNIPHPQEVMDTVSHQIAVAKAMRKNQS